MPYIAAKDVDSPRGSWQLVRVIYDAGPSTAGKFNYSYAAGFWEGRPVLVGRWNGTDKAPVGFPQSRGLAVWHVLDDANDPGYEFELAKLDKIAPQHSQFLRGFLALKMG
jgi:hypothetical protein